MLQAMQQLHRCNLRQQQTPRESSERNKSQVVNPFFRESTTRQDPDLALTLPQNDRGVC
jgi:hypothetical protein